MATEFSKVGHIDETWNHLAVNPFTLLLICLAGWMNRHQQDVIEYLQEEIRVLKELLDKKPRFNDHQRR